MGAQEFITTAHKEHNWPYPKPIAGRPCEPPKPKQEARKAPPAVAPYCHCDTHAYDPKLEQYKQLVDKEKKLCSDYDKLRAQMVAVTNDILDHPCDDANTKMATIYNMDFKRRSFPITDYRALVASAQSPAEIPRPAFRIGRLRCYKDPTTFVHTPVVRPTIHPPAEASLGVTPETIAAWSAEFPGRTEYQDTYSRCAKATWRATQRYREPMPSTRRREDDPCL